MILSEGNFQNTNQSSHFMCFNRIQSKWISFEYNKKIQVCFGVNQSLFLGLLSQKYCWIPIDWKKSWFKNDWAIENGVGEFTRKHCFGYAESSIMRSNYFLKICAKADSTLHIGLNIIDLYKC